MGYLDWKPGDKLACLYDHGQGGFLTKPWQKVTAGQVYTLRKIFRWPTTIPGCFDFGVELDEMPDDRPYSVGRFRKVQERETSIEVFHQLRRNAERKRKVPAG